MLRLAMSIAASTAVGLRSDFIVGFDPFRPTLIRDSAGRLPF